MLPHRTQILYLPDISLVCHYLELKPGAVVVESGTGSGSLTHSLVRAVAPHGHVYTFEFNQVRAEEAAKEIVDHGLTGQCTVTHRDIEADGFPLSLEGCADAVFLDLPGGGRRRGEKGDVVVVLLLYRAVLALHACEAAFTTCTPGVSRFLRKKKTKTIRKASD